MSTHPLSTFAKMMSMLMAMMMRVNGLVRVAKYRA
jgi:hypothetical protein